MVDQGEVLNMAHSRKKPLRKKIIKYSFILLFVALVVSVTAIAHLYGPYTGKVVVLETGEPIDGAAVLMVFHTVTFFAAGATADAVETVTDQNGEFSIPWYLALTFRPFHSWKPDGYVKIFKPGYGVYPDHRAALPRFKIGGTLPEKQYVTIQLPRLKTNEERSRNLSGIEPGGDVPDRKMRTLLMLKSEERVNIGLTPLPIKRYGR